jgi:hypothetical protein
LNFRIHHLCFSSLSFGSEGEKKTSVMCWRMVPLLSSLSEEGQLSMGLVWLSPVAPLCWLCCGIVFADLWKKLTTSNRIASQTIATSRCLDGAKYMKNSRDFSFSQSNPK